MTGDFLQATSFFLVFLFGLFLGLSRPDKKDIPEETDEVNFMDEIAAGQERKRLIEIKKTLKKLKPSKKAKYEESKAPKGRPVKYGPCI